MIQLDKKEWIILAVAIVLIIVIIAYFVFRKSSAVGQTIDLTKCSLISSYPDASGKTLNANQVYSYTGNGIFTGVTSPTLFLFVFQLTGSSTIYGLVDNANSYITNTPASVSAPGTWSGAGIVDITTFASKYNDVTPITLGANTVSYLPKTITPLGKY